MSQTRSAAFLTNSEAIGLPGNDSFFGIYRKGQLDPQTLVRQGLFKQGWDEDGRLLLTLGSDTPVVTLRPLLDRATINKGEFKNAHAAIAKGEALTDEQQQLVAAFSDDQANFHAATRTVGCGVNMFFQFSDGTILQAAVKRTEKVPSGVVGAGNFSRAAGGAETDIPDTQVRESTEEMLLFIKGDDGRLTLLNIDQSDRLVTSDRMRDLFIHRRDGLYRFADKINELSESGYDNLDTLHLRAQPLKIPGLHQMVTQDIMGKRSSFAAVYADDAANGDISGIDRTCFVVLPDGVRPDQLQCIDGELDMSGKPLDRDWLFADPMQLLADKQSGLKKFSNAPGKVVEQAPTMLAAIRSEKYRAAGYACAKPVKYFYNRC